LSLMAAFGIPFDIDRRGDDDAKREKAACGDRENGDAPAFRLRAGTDCQKAVLGINDGSDRLSYAAVLHFGAGGEQLLCGFHAFFSAGEDELIREDGMSLNNGFEFVEPGLLLRIIARLRF